MKKIILLSCAIVFSLVIEAQAAKWFVTLSTGRQIAGPSSSLKKYMNDNGFNVTSQGFIFGPADYPHTVHGPNLICMFGRTIGNNNNRSVYFLLGMPGNAEVRGYDGSHPNNIKYHIYQLGGGYQFSSSNSRSKLGGGPSLFILNSGKNNDYQTNNLTEKHTAVRPGLSITGSTPLGKQRRLLGIELFAELNIAANESFVDLQSYDGKSPYDMNMIEGLLGLSIAVRRPSHSLTK